VGIHGPDIQFCGKARDDVKFLGRPSRKSVQEIESRMVSVPFSL
jgi:hypothetical protein